jgi:hypothetical protein
MRFTMFNVMHGLGWGFSISGRYGCCCYDASGGMNGHDGFKQCLWDDSCTLRPVQKIQSNRRLKETCSVRGYCLLANIRAGE